MPQNSEETIAPAHPSDAEMIQRFAAHGVTRDNVAHYRGRLERRLLMARCADCGRWQHPPRPMCPSCWSWDLSMEEVSGRGAIHLLTVLHQGPSADGVDYTDGHPVVTVEFDDQPALRFTSTVTDDFPAEDLRIGTPVELVWGERNGMPFPLFARAGR